MRKKSYAQVAFQLKKKRGLEKRTWVGYDEKLCRFVGQYEKIFAQTFVHLSQLKLASSLSYHMLPNALVVMFIIIYFCRKKNIFETDEKLIKCTSQMNCEVIHKLSVRFKLMSAALGASTNYVHNFLLPDRLHFLILPTKNLSLARQ